MRKWKHRILSLLTACTLVFLLFPQVTFATDISELKAAYQASLARYNDAVANLALKQDRYEGLIIVSSDNYIVLTTEYQVDPSELEVSEENYQHAYQRKVEEEQILLNAQESFTEATENYQAMCEQVQDGTFSFYQWVKTNYPQYRKDVTKALSILNAGVNKGYLQRGNLLDSTSLYCNKLALQYLHEYISLQSYFQDDEQVQEMVAPEQIGMTNFELMAYAQYNAGHAAQQNEHLQSYLNEHNLGETLVSGHLTNTDDIWSFYDSTLSPHSPANLTIPQTGDDDIPTFEEWRDAWLAQYPNIEEELPWLFQEHDEYLQWFLMEKYQYDTGLSDASQVEDFLHILYSDSAGMGIAFTNVDETDADFILAHDYTHGEYNNLFTVDTYESLLDEYVASLNLISCTNDFVEAKNLVEEQAEIVLEAQVLDAYFSSSLSIPGALSDFENAQEEVEDAADELARAKEAFGIFAPISVENIHAENQGNQIVLHWDTVTASSSRYMIYRRTPDTDWTLLHTQLGTVYLDTQVVSGTQYEYSIVAVNKYGQSDLVTHASLMHLSTPALQVSTQFHYRQNSVMASMTWQAIEGATEYEIYQNTPAGLQFVTKVTENHVLFCGSDCPEIPEENHIVVSPSPTALSYGVVAVSGSSRSEISKKATILIPPRNVCTVTVNNHVYEVQGYEAVLDKTTGDTISAVPMKVRDTVTIRWRLMPSISLYDVWRVTSTGAAKNLGTVYGSFYRYKPTGTQSYYFFAVPHITESWSVAE